MARRRSLRRVKPHVNVGTIGHVDHGEDDVDGSGKLQKVLSKHNSKVTFRAFDSIDNARTRRAGARNHHRGVARGV